MALRRKRRRKMINWKRKNWTIFVVIPLFVVCWLLTETEPEGHNFFYQHSFLPLRRWYPIFGREREWEPETIRSPYTSRGGTIVRWSMVARGLMVNGKMAMRSDDQTTRQKNSEFKEFYFYISQKGIRWKTKYFVALYTQFLLFSFRRRLKTFLVLIHCIWCCCWRAAEWKKHL